MQRRKDGLPLPTAPGQGSLVRKEGKTQGSSKEVAHSRVPHFQGLTPPQPPELTLIASLSIPVVLFDHLQISTKGSERSWGFVTTQQVQEELHSSGPGLRSLLLATFWY